MLNNNKLKGLPKKILIWMICGMVNLMDLLNNKLFKRKKRRESQDKKQEGSEITKTMWKKTLFLELFNQKLLIQGKLEMIHAWVIDK